MVDGAYSANELPRHGLHAHIRFLVFCRLEELLHGCLNAIRCQNLPESSPERSLEVFAAAVILRYELVYFRKSLRNGPLSKLEHLPPQFKRILVSWFAELETELTRYLRLGCGRYVGWQDAMGPKKASRRSEETFSLNISLDINKFTVCGKPPPATKFTNPAGGDAFLISPQQSPLLQALAMSYDMPDGIEQLPHVVTSTSVVIVSDLYPDLQFLLRTSDEDEDEILTDYSY
ncbi:hypothetical protein IFR05_004349 [Cadophora sp. M221]|nr:hypothetical protein IFR05_004349 [Cadophora sp. M221]